MLTDGGIKFVPGNVTLRIRLDTRAGQVDRFRNTQGTLNFILAEI
jgi:hypothetical protein